MDRIKIVIVAGPTASGKSALGLSLARRFNGEIVSADSMQIYRQLKIATAKPDSSETKGIAHHLIDIKNADEEFSAAEFVLLAAACIKDISSRGKLPIIVGGTGLYIDKLLENNCFDSLCRDNGVRKQLEADYDFNPDALYNELCRIDPVAAKKIHKNNKKRVVRAMEVIRLTGERFSSLGQTAAGCESPYSTLYFGLCYADRNTLYERINNRVDRMMADGLLAEVQDFYKSGNIATSAQAIGCKELLPYISGEASLEQCVMQLKQSTRHYAKRQLTWFRRNENIVWITADVEDAESRATELCKEFLRGE